ncbi:MAG: hypothetical protein LIR46_03000 [Bacteroidota bacterium]|nr:hypothetical protein [Bacteroidota bacterium]
MSNEMVQIRTVKQYFKDFIVEGLKDKTKITDLDLYDIKQKILKEFQKEIFGQVVFKLGPEAATMTRDQLASMDGIHNILVQAFRKWRRLCILCTEKGLGNYFQLEDLQKALDENEPDPENVVTVPDIEEDVTEQVKDQDIVYLEKEKENDDSDNS